MAKSVRSNNGLPFCDSESEAYLDYVSRLVNDLEIGSLSKDDLLALGSVYAGETGCKLLSTKSNYITNLCSIQLLLQCFHIKHQHHKQEQGHHHYHHHHHHHHHHHQQ